MLQVPFHTHTHTHAQAQQYTWTHSTHLHTLLHAHPCTPHIHKDMRILVHACQVTPSVLDTCGGTHVLTHSFTYTWTHTCADGTRTHTPRHTHAHTRVYAVPRQRGLELRCLTPTLPRRPVWEGCSPASGGEAGTREGKGLSRLEGAGERACREVEVGSGRTRGVQRRAGRRGCTNCEGDLSLWQATPDPEGQRGTSLLRQATWDPGQWGPHSSAGHMGLQDRGVRVTSACGRPHGTPGQRGNLTPQQAAPDPRDRGGPQPTVQATRSPG